MLASMMLFLSVQYEIDELRVERVRCGGDGGIVRWECVTVSCNLMQGIYSGIPGFRAAVTFNALNGQAHPLS